MGKTPKQKYIITKKNASCIENDETRCLKSFARWEPGTKFQHCIKLSHFDVNEVVPNPDTFYCPINYTDSSGHNEASPDLHSYAICQDGTNCKRHCFTYPQINNAIGARCTIKPENDCRYVNPGGIWLQGLRCEKGRKKWKWKECMPDCLSWKLSSCKSSNNMFYKYDHICNNVSKEAI